MLAKCEHKCSKCAVNASWIGLGESFFFTLFKGIVGILTGSRALTASALYSMHDVVSNVAILIGLRTAVKPADKDYPYGRGNVEYVVTSFTSIVILGATIFLIVDCGLVFFTGEHPRPHWAALAAAIVSAFSGEVIYQFDMCAHRHINSPAILCHAKHHRADAISSVVVAAAILAGMMGYGHLDLIVALFETVHLTILNIEILRHGTPALIDRAIDEGEILQIKRVLSDMPDISRVEDVKTRQIGRSVWVDLYVSLPGERTMLEVNAISKHIRARIDQKVKYLGNVNVICV